MLPPLPPLHPPPLFYLQLPGGPGLVCPTLPPLTGCHNYELSTTNFYTPEGYKTLGPLITTLKGFIIIEDLMELNDHQKLFDLGYNSLRWCFRRTFLENVPAAKFCSCETQVGQNCSFHLINTSGYNKLAISYLALS